MTIWFTADQHFGHENIIKYCHRPFASVEEMDAALIQKWNDVVQEGDTVWHLGDLSYKASGTKVMDVLYQLNGTIRLLYLPWHHDKQWIDDLRLFDVSVFEQWLPIDCKKDKALKFDPPLTVLKLPDLPVITLSHYPMASWEASFHGAWHLHGHSHGMYHALGKLLDVGVDNCNYTPISLEEVVAYMETMQQPVFDL